MSHNGTVLSIETSCDDTAAAVVLEGEVRSSIISSQRVHAGYGGVVPELASRAHQRLIVPIVEEALSEAGIVQGDVSAVAATYGPGLAGSLLVGLSFAKAYAFGLGVPFVGVNHLEGHVYSLFVDAPRPVYPFLCLIVSGGHTQLVLVEAAFQHSILGKTRDDAAGEAFDKVAKLLGLGYPGGPRIDELAREGDAAFRAFPRSKPGGYDFSFSGLKTSVLYYLNSFTDVEREALLEDHLPDVCASFQQAIVDVLVDALRRAVRETGVGDVGVVGGVSANSALRAAAQEMTAAEGVSIHFPAPALCMDNAAMIGVTAHHKLLAGITSPLSLTADPSLALAPPLATVS